MDIIPRGGICRECHTYVLWGDVIRGCYRRQKGGANLVDNPDSEEESEKSEVSGVQQSDVEDSDTGPTKVPVVPPRSQTEKTRKAKGKRKARSPVAGPSKVTPKERKSTSLTYDLMSCFLTRLLLNSFEVFVS